MIEGRIMTAYPSPVSILAALLWRRLPLLSSCSPAKPALAAQLPEVSIVTVQRGRVPVTLDFPARTAAYLVAEVRARAGCIVLRRDFEKGAEVRVGQRLYQIDRAPYRAALDSATGTWLKSQANLLDNERAAQALKTARRRKCGKQAGL